MCKDGKRVRLGMKIRSIRGKTDGNETKGRYGIPKRNWGRRRTPEQQVEVRGSSQVRWECGPRRAAQEAERESTGGSGQVKYVKLQCAGCCVRHHCPTRARMSLSSHLGRRSRHELEGAGSGDSGQSLLHWDNQPSCLMPKARAVHIGQPISSSLSRQEEGGQGYR